MAVQLFVVDGNANKIMSGVMVESEFKSLSRGYKAIGKVDGLFSAPYVEFTDDAGAHSVIDCPAKDFKTNSKGYFGSAKLTLNGKSYQGQAQFVLIGSKTGEVKRPGYYQVQIQLVEIHSKPGMHEADEAKAEKGKTAAERELEKAAEFKRRADKRMAEAQAKAAKRGVDVQTVLNEETAASIAAAS